MEEILAKRFWPKVDIRSFDECWPWKSSTGKGGYGHLRSAYDLCGTACASRIAFFLTYGRWPIPCALHGCDNPPCCNAVNPLHIHEGTSERNSQEMVERSRGTRYSLRLFTDDECRELAELNVSYSLRYLARVFEVKTATMRRAIANGNNEEIYYRRGRIMRPDERGH